MSPEKVDVNIWMWIAGVLITGWSGLLSYTLRAFGMRLNKLEEGKVPVTQCGFFRENNHQILLEIKEELKDNSEDIGQIKTALATLSAQLEIFMKGQ